MALRSKVGFIYLIRNRVNGKGYVGQTVKSVRKRFLEHLRAAANGSDFAIHSAIRKHGEQSFIVEEIVACDASLLNALEEYCVMFYGTSATFGHGYNLTNGGKATSGWSPSIETRAKMSASQKGRKQSPEHVAKAQAARRPYQHSAEMRLKISEACKGKKKPRRGKD